MACLGACTTVNLGEQAAHTAATDPALSSTQVALRDHVAEFERELIARGWLDDPKNGGMAAKALSVLVHGWGVREDDAAAVDDVGDEASDEAPTPDPVRTAEQLILDTSDAVRLSAAVASAARAVLDDPAAAPVAFAADVAVVEKAIAIGRRAQAYLTADLGALDTSPSRDGAADNLDALDTVLTGLGGAADALNTRRKAMAVG